MAPTTLTEQLPSSGQAQCEHDWQKVEGGSDDPSKVMMVCKKEGCSASKLVNKPVVQEAAEGKKLLLG